MTDDAVPGRNRYYSGPVSDHFDGERFYSPGGAADKSLRELLRMAAGSRKRVPWPKIYPRIAFDKPPARVEGRRLRVVFVGHSTFLVQTEGLNLLLDPVWAKRVGPFGRLGPRRVLPPAIHLPDLPPLDAILLSHNHYDHMDVEALSRLAQLRPCPVLTPLGNDVILQRADARIDARAFDWGESVDIGAAKIHFEPARHWSARRGNDRRRALWSSFVVQSPNRKIYFAGDTGFGDGDIFRALRAKHGRVDLALLPIGAYAPRWFMRDQHVDPEEAVRIFSILEADRALACHWSTYRLTEEPWDDPPRRLAEALDWAGIARGKFVAGLPGTILDLA